MAEVIARNLQQTLQPGKQQEGIRSITLAEQQLQMMERNQGFGQTLLSMLMSEYSPDVRFSAAVYFKNYIKRNWECDSINATDKDQIKQGIVNLMVTLPSREQQQLSEAVAIIAKLDFPQKWQNLTQELVQRLTPDNYQINNGVLKTAHSIFRRWRDQFRSNELFTEILMVIELFGLPLITMLQDVDLKLSKADNKMVSDLYLETMILISKIFYSCNIQDLPEFFEDRQTVFFPIFLKYLEVTPELDSELEKLQISIVEIAILYTERYSEDWHFYTEFVKAIWKLLVKISPLDGFGVLLSKSMRMLTIVVQRPISTKWFGVEQITDIIRGIVVPNMMLKANDLEAIEDDPYAFVQQEMEGIDSDTRRKASLDVVKALLFHFEETTVTQLYSIVMTMISKNIVIDKDCAVNLFLACSFKTHSTSLGVPKTAKLLLDPQEFFEKNLVQDLNSNSPILALCCAKFISMFRLHLKLLPCLSSICSNLTNPNIIISVSSAIAVDRILSTIENPPQNVVFGLAETIISIAGNQQNHFLLRTLVRTIKNGFMDTNLIFSKCLTLLSSTASNPLPKFTHYIFEVVGITIKMLFAKNVKDYSQLYPLCTQILSCNVPEFIPYILQIISQIVQYSNQDETLIHFFEQVTIPKMWDVHFNVPSLVMVVSSYLAKFPAMFSNDECRRLKTVLGIFQSLLLSKRLETFALDILQSVFSFMNYNVLRPFVAQILTLILQRLSQESKKNSNFVQAFVSFWGVFLAAAPTVDLAFEAFDLVQNGIGFSLLQCFVCESLASIQNIKTLRTAFLGYSRFASDSKYALQNHQLLENLLFLLATSAPSFKMTNQIFPNQLFDDLGSGDEEILIDQRISNSAFSKLQSAATISPIMPNVVDPYVYFVQSLTKIGAANSALVNSVLSKLPNDLSAIYMRELGL